MKTEIPPSLPQFEPSDAHPRLVVGLGAGLFVLIGIGVFVAHLMLPAGRFGAKSGGLPSLGPGATDAADVQRAWAQQDARVREHLERYAWVDRGRGIVQIPIEEAMRLQASKEAAP